jgi:transposase-like protein
MAQHFLLSAAARTLSLKAVAGMSEDEARATFVAIRWSDNEGKPYCPKCGCLTVYTYAARKIWKCKGCTHQFSATSGTIFASHKLPIRDYLMAIALCVNGAKGMSALQLSRDLDVQYKTAFVLAHKLREAVAALRNERKLSGEVEVDGAYFGGYVKPRNHKENRRDRRLSENQTGKRRVVVIMRERNGKSLPFVFNAEHQSLDTIKAHVEAGTKVYADEASGWDALVAKYEMGRINHRKSYRTPEANTNQAESFFSRLRRAEIGTHHKIAGPYLAAYAREMAWREDYRRVSNGEQYRMVAHAALIHPASANWTGYWQRSFK